MNGKKLKDIFKKENKNLKADIFSIFVIGVVLIIMGNTFFSGKTNEKSEALVKTNEETVCTVSNNQEELEKRLENILSSVAGAGELKVMVTTSYSSESVVAQEIKKEENNTTQKGGDKEEVHTETKNYENRTVLIENSDGSTKPLVLKEIEPKVEGVVIVAQGGDNILVKDSLSKAAQALLNVPAHKVEVLKMK